MPTAQADEGWEHAMRPDGRGGWYAIVAVVGRYTGVPRSGLDEHYVLQIVGTQSAVHLFVLDEFLNWWHGDRFVAHLRPHRQDGQADSPADTYLTPELAELDAPHFADFASSSLPLLDVPSGVLHPGASTSRRLLFDPSQPRRILRLQVTGLVPIEAGDTTTLEDIVAGRQPMPETKRGWPREWHVRVTVAVTRDRRWRTILPQCPSWAPRCASEAFIEQAGLPPPPRNAKVGAHYACILAAGKLTHWLGEVAPPDISADH
jgi:hypothetical protein